MESLSKFERGTQYTLVQHNQAGWTPLFFFRFYYEPRQCHNARDRRKDSETSQLYVKTIQFYEKYFYLNVPLSRPAVVLEIVIACRMVLAGEIPERSSRPESKHELEVHPWCADDTMDLKAPASDEK